MFHDYEPRRRTYFLHHLALTHVASYAQRGRDILRPVQQCASYSLQLPFLYSLSSQFLCAMSTLIASRKSVPSKTML